MAKSKKPDNLEVARNAAQTFTVSAAVLYGLFWLITSTLDLTSDSIDVLTNALLIATAVGGVIMGMLYLFKLAEAKR